MTTTQETRMRAFPDLRDQVVIVTGAGKGIGRAAALHLAACGARVLVNNRRHPGEADEATSAAQVVAQIRAAGGQAQAHYARADDPAAGQQMVDDALATWGRLDMVYANAALPQDAAFHRQTLDELRAVIDTGVVGTLSLFHAAWPVFRAQKSGRALASTSSAGRFGGVGMTAYAASKGALDSLVRSLAAEGARSGIRCNALSPYAASQMTQGYLPPDLAQALAPEHLGPLVAWLLSPDCELNGEVVVAGGGRYARAWPVETRAVRGEDLPAVWAELLRLEGRPHRDAVTAFQAFMQDA
jgi:NAD(P)-dependent dehydrogenase (short-subunit alcohol dehydrogenase family)